MEAISPFLGVPAPEAEAPVLEQSHMKGRNACYTFLGSTDTGVGSTARRSGERVELLGAPWAAW